MKTAYDRMMENDSYQKTKDFIIKQKWPYLKKRPMPKKSPGSFTSTPMLPDGAM
jgi:hypothetical protein